MLDPLSAVSLAGNILQFIEFAVKLTRGGIEIYKSPDGTPPEIISLDEITKDLLQLSSQLVVQDNHYSTSTEAQPKDAIKDDIRLARLAKICQDVATELSQTLDSLKRREDSHHLKWDAFQRSLRHLMKKNQIKELQTRLEAVRDELNTRFLFKQSEDTSRLLKELDRISNESERLGTHIQSLESLKEDIIEEIKGMREVRDNRGSSPSFGARVAQLGDVGTLISKEQIILGSLHYRTIKIRFENLREAHTRTFQWAFNSNDVHLREWLEQESGIFWISGKAGSGKSTLMKLLCQHSGTDAALTRWAKTMKLIKAHHFFWYSGPAEQKTSEGLLRSLLFQVLREVPKLIPIVFPRQWKEVGIYFRDKVPFTRAQLADSFKTLVYQDSIPIKICIFVDGLDEFEESEENGSFKDLLELFKSFSTAPNLKMCLATRPWPFVLDTLKESQRKIFMQDLTKSDMNIYAQAQLSQYRGFSGIINQEKFTSQIVEKAQGIFLWVYLVVRSLMKGLENGDSPTDLERRLESVPEGLERLFERMLQSVDPFYRSSSARMLQVAIQSNETLPLLAYQFVEMEKEDPDYAVTKHIQEVNRQNVLVIRDEMRKRLHARTSDLFEVISEGTYKVWRTPAFLNFRVAFVHRTVREFLIDSGDVQKMLSQYAPEFDPRLSLCRLHLALVKAIPADVFADTFWCVQPMIQDFFDTVKQRETAQNESDVVLLDELDRLVTARRHKQGEHDEQGGQGGHWAAKWKGNGKVSNFFDLARNQELKFYIDSKVKEKPVWKRWLFRHSQGKRRHFTRSIFKQNWRG